MGLSYFKKLAELKKEVKLQAQQQRVLDKLNLKDALLLYHNLGSGKTLSAIAATHDRDTDFVVPASLRENVRKELKKFTKSNKSDVTSYHKYWKQEVKPKDALVLDEAHRLGNAATAMSKKVQEEASKYKKRILLTGSPISNHPWELAFLAKILSPEKEVPVGRKPFEESFIKSVKVNPGLWGRLKGVTPGENLVIKNKNKFRELFKGKVDYHDVGKKHYPRVNEETVQVEMSKGQRKLYDKALKSAPVKIQYKIREGIPLSRAEKVHLNQFLNAVRQISNSTTAYGLDKPTPKIKKVIEDIKETLETNRNAKTVLYSNYLKSGVEDVANQLVKERIPYGIFSGKINDKKRRELVQRYNSGKIKTLLLTRAGSEGLDLKGTNLMQILEPHWNEARTNQAKGRTIRYKSHDHLPEKDRVVQVKNYESVLPRKLYGLMKGDKSVDEYLKELGGKKTQLNEQFLDVLRELGKANESL